MAPPYTTDHTFDSIDRVVEPLRFNGWSPYSFVGYIHDFQDYNPPNRSLAVYTPNRSTISWAYWKTKALANMNPNKPVVDLPLFLFEFKDFPRMLRDLGRILTGLGQLADFAGQYLAYSFGWAPLVGDVLDLFGIAKSIEDRKAYLLRLEGGTAVKRSLGTHVLQDVYTPNGYDLAFTPQTWRWDTHRKEVMKVWFTANAKLLTPLPHADRLQGLSQDLVLGLRIHPATVWNMLPWSWLIDYFANVGDFLEAQQGHIKTSVTRMNIMAEQVITDNLSNPRMAATCVATGGNFTVTSRLRQIYANPTPSLSFTPFLTGGQMANLGALATVKALKAL
jgi:hypothetical protein